VRALVITKHGPPEVLRVEERPDPTPGPGEVRVAVRAAGINFADTSARMGIYPDAPKPPCVVGYEFAGEVESLGEGAEGVAVGDRVMGGCRFGAFGQAIEQLCRPTAQVAARQRDARADRSIQFDDAGKGLRPAEIDGDDRRRCSAHRGRPAVAR